MACHRAAHALTLAAALILMPTAQAGPPVLDFGDPATVRAFRIINDDVMGGVSTSRVGEREGALVFEGEVSLANNGGFASCRGPVALPRAARVLLVTLRGDGQRYKLTLRLDGNPGSGQYQATFVAPREWQTLRFEPADFAASFRGRPLDLPPVRFGEVRFIGLLISDRQAGPFGVELRDVRIE